MVVMMTPLVSSWTSGDSTFAWLRTRTKPSVNEAPVATVPVAAPSNAYGTSTPSTARPSARRYATWTLVIVTWLFVLGATLMSLGARLSVTEPGSVKKVGHGL